MVRKTKAWMYILVSLIAVALVIAIILGIYYTKNISYAAEVNETKLVTEVPITKKDKEKEINIDEIVENNIENKVDEENLESYFKLTLSTTEALTNNEIVNLSFYYNKQRIITKIKEKMF